MSMDDTRDDSSISCEQGEVTFKLVGDLEDNVLRVCLVQSLFSCSKLAIISSTELWPKCFSIRGSCWRRRDSPVCRERNEVIK